MFTGLITHIGTVETLSPLESGMRLRVNTDMSDGSLQMGESIACDGCCLTVVAFESGWFEVDVSRESLRRTNLEGKKEGDPLNLERAMRVGDRLGGHWVQGHVDAVGTLEAAAKAGESIEIIVKFPADLRQYIVAKGSITVSGVSLTVNTVEEDSLAINLIPHTWDHTTFHRLKTGDQLNLEVDILAKYVETLIRPYRR